MFLCGFVVGLHNTCYRTLGIVLETRAGRIRCGPRNSRSLHSARAYPSGKTSSGRDDNDPVLTGSGADSSGADSSGAHCCLSRTFVRHAPVSLFSLISLGCI